MSTDQSPVPETSVPTCYRHPSRETYVRCTRCDRFICPECMRDAAVGHQCVECVAEGNRGSARRFPGRSSARGARRPPCRSSPTRSSARASPRTSPSWRPGAWSGTS
ncbi:hypothetical protein ACFQY7_40040 [Actinomadura luteofluorescens]|uniref:hypothetical protein n=1 Tax=Actinomadura luteofluorescens TaxID=46163 RepID=UPI0036392120